jgi:hypothetical protein
VLPVSDGIPGLFAKTSELIYLVRGDSPSYYYLCLPTRKMRLEPARLPMSSGYEDARNTEIEVMT